MSRQRKPRSIPPRLLARRRKLCRSLCPHLNLRFRTANSTSVSQTERTSFPVQTSEAEDVSFARQCEAKRFLPRIVSSRRWLSRKLVASKNATEFMYMEYKLYCRARGKGIADSTGKLLQRATLHAFAPGEAEERSELSILVCLKLWSFYMRSFHSNVYECLI